VLDELEEVVDEEEESESLSELEEEEEDSAFFRFLVSFAFFSRSITFSIRDFSISSLSLVSASVVVVVLEASCAASVAFLILKIIGIYSLSYSHSTL